MKIAAKSRLVRTIARALGRSGLRRGDLVLLGLSGGPDSVALLHLLRELEPGLGMRLAAAHLNHRLRGAESDRDEAFVRELCADMGVELVVEQARGLVPGTSNLEERAREARYEFFARAARKLGASYVATAHHADDQSETVMLRLLRGSGLAGLGAMAPVDSMAVAGADSVANPGFHDAGVGSKATGSGKPRAVGEPRALTLVRPMLQVRRADILAYIEAIRARFVSDSSNEYPEFWRNRVRRELLPALERSYVPGLSRRLAALADEMREVDDFLSRAAEAELEQRWNNGALSLEGFAGLHPALAKALLRAFVASRIGNLRRISRRHIENLHRLALANSPSASIALPGGWRAARRYAALTLERQPEASRGIGYARAGFSVPLAREGRTDAAESGFVFYSTVAAADATPLPADPFEACFDAEAAAAGLVVRNFVPGDRIAPLGIEGRRKVHDVFVDRKLARARRASYPVVTLEETVVWLPGLLRGRIALITPSTRRVLRVRARNIRDNV
jgi:tRNA(Ile)-lysidine synthase